MTELKRSANFSGREETILLSLVKQFMTVLENKKTDSNNNKKKQECWKQIQNMFNCESGGVFRDYITLKKKYDNIKKKTKKKIADQKCYVLGTGGGPAKKPPEFSDVEKEINEILGDRISGNFTEFGGDAEIITIINDTENENIMYDSNDDQPDQPTITKEDNGSYKENITGDGGQTDWSKYSIESLKTPTSKPLTTGDSNKKRKRNEYDAMCSKVSEWAASKAGLEAAKIKFAEEEKEYRIKLIQNKFEKESELMKNESEARIKRINREMEVTVEGIIEQNKLKKDILVVEKHLMLQKLKSSNVE